MLNGVIIALASFRQAGNDTHYGALDEDEGRWTAEAALDSFGPDARPFLLDAVERFKFSNAPSFQLRKCRSLLSLLGELRLSSDDIDQLRSFMANPDLRVPLLACRIGCLRSESQRPLEGPSAAQATCASACLGVSNRRSTSTLPQLGTDHPQETSARVLST